MRFTLDGTTLIKLRSITLDDGLKRKFNLLVVNKSVPSSLQNELNEFDSLLHWLNSDREAAGVAYEKLRSRLLKVFISQGAAAAEDLVDEVFTRTARKLSEGVQVQATDPFIYCYGIARNVLREYRKLQLRVGESIERDESTNRQPPEPAIHPAIIELEETERQEREHRLTCLEHALSRLTTENRVMFLEYYRHDIKSKTNHREQLADSLGMPMNAIRIRVHRLKAKLEESIRKCLTRTQILQKKA
ncbi:MAG TPA: sigma-70 family RNA polymerase sigma factor [Acidobacteriota bacterium]|nr:sigma-70 family RNA polymerase sigma factor [Acidobacteriota bacterium]